MPESFIIRDFSGGWAPSDAEINSSPNALLQMTNLTLDEGGVVNLHNGTSKVVYGILASGDYGAAAHTLFSKTVGGVKQRYVSLVTGETLRNETSIIGAGSGSTLRTAYGVAFNYVLIASGNVRIKDNGTISNLYVTAPTVAPSTVFVNFFQPPTGPVGTYEWKYIYVENTGSYQARSLPSPVSNPTTLTADARITLGFTAPPNPSWEIWVFRRTYNGEGNLEEWYRTAVLTAFPWQLNPDSRPDRDIIAENVKLSDYTQSLDPASTTDAILEMAGPVYERMFYFTSGNILISERNSPSTYDYRQVMAFSDSLSEAFLFAKQVGENTIVIGTTKDIYILTGTFTELPDGFLDVYLRPLGVSEAFRPISRNVTIYDGALVYCASTGWRLFSIPGGPNISLVTPTVDKLYKGETRYGYVPIFRVLPEDSSTSCAVVKDQLFVVNHVSGAWRMECFDLIRKYWRPINYADNVALLYAEEDNTLIGHFNTSHFLRILDWEGSKLFDQSSNQSFSFLTKSFEISDPFRRKELTLLKAKCLTGGQDVTVTAYFGDDFSTPNVLGTLTSVNFTEKFLDLSSFNLVTKRVQLGLTGTVSNFKLGEIEIVYDPRPIQTTYIYIPSTNFGTPSRKRVRSLPFQLDPIAGNVTVTPRIDGVLHSNQLFNYDRKKTFAYYFTSDIIGIDYEFFVQGAAPFEFFGFAEPDMEVFPRQTKFFRIPDSNYGTPSPKKLSVWPFLLDARNDAVTFTPILDGVAGSTTSFSSDGKRQFFHHFTTDVAPIVFGGSLSSATPFELWEVGNPIFTEIKPTECKYDQLGPIDLFKYGKISEIGVRLIAEGFGSFNVAFHLDGEIVHMGIINVQASEINQDRVYWFKLPKTVAGTVLRVIIGPALFTFRRYYIVIRTAKSGRDTENEYILLPEQA